MADLRAFTRELMADAESDLGTRLDWVAVDHWNRSSNGLAEQVSPAQWTLKPASSQPCAISSWPPPHRVRAGGYEAFKRLPVRITTRRYGISTGDEVRMVPAVASAEPLLF